MYVLIALPNTVNYIGGRVVHSYGRLIPNEFPITDLQQISDSCGIGRMNCTVSSGKAMFIRPGEKKLEVAGVTSTIRNGATLVVKRNDVSGFQLYCSSTISPFFSLSLSSAS